MKRDENILNKSISEIGGKYMNLNKKQYYLASVDENVSMLQKKQIYSINTIDMKTKKL